MIRVSFRRRRPLERVLRISGARLTDVLGGHIEEMRGDAIARERMDALLVRDCARRRLVEPLLLALDAESRYVLLAHVSGWRPGVERDAAIEVLTHAWHGPGGDAEP